jgi:hypothetical protein
MKVASSAAPERALAAKRQRDRERRKYRPRKSRAKVDRAWLDAPGVPLADAPAGKRVRADKDHLRMLRDLHGVVELAEPDTDGTVMQWDVDRVRAAWAAVYGSEHLPENEWVGRLRGMLYIALLIRGKVKAPFLVALDHGGDNGHSILRKLREQGVAVPARITPARIDATLLGSTLGRGGGQRGLVNWRNAFEALVRPTR